MSASAETALKLADRDGAIGALCSNIKRCCRVTGGSLPNRGDLLKLTQASATLHQAPPATVRGQVAMLTARRICRQMKARPVAVNLEIIGAPCGLRLYFDCTDSGLAEDEAPEPVNIPAVKKIGLAALKAEPEPVVAPPAPPPLPALPPPSEAIAARDEAVERVRRKADPAWLAAAEKAVCCLAQSGEPFTADHVLVWLAKNAPGVATGDTRALGPVMLAMARRRVIEGVGEQRKSALRSCHCRRKTVWRGVVHG